MSFDLKDLEKNDWNIQLLNNLFEVEYVHVICNLKWPDVVYEDKLLWKGSKDGTFSVQSSYCLQFLGSNDILIFQKLWQSNLHI